MANISTYPIGTPAQGDLIPGTQKYTNSSGKTENLTRNFTVQSIASFANSYNLGYTVYTALITQTGTAAPVATVLQNTTGGTIAWTRPTNPGAGRYVATISGANFTANKTTVIVTSGGNSNMILRPAAIVPTAIDWYNINAQNGNVGDVIKATTTVEIRIYS